MNTRKARFYLAISVSLLTVVIYSSALRNDFVLWDDNVDIYENTHLRVLNTDFLLWAFSTQGKGLFEPVTWLSYAVDHALSGPGPAGYHLTSVLLHGINVFLVVYLVGSLMEAARGADRRLAMPQYEQGILITAGTTAALFGLHPLQVEAIAWAAARPALLQTLFSLASLMCYIRYAVTTIGTDREAAGPLIARGSYLCSLVFFLAALGSKASAITLPFVFFLLDWYPLKRFHMTKSPVVLIAEKLPFIACSIFLSIVTFLAQQGMGTMDTALQTPVFMRILVASKALALYLGRVLLPIDLSPFYAYPEAASLLSLPYSAAVLLLISIAIGCLLLAENRPLVPATWLFFLITLLPVIGLVKVREIYMADRYAYLANLGPFLLIGLATRRVWMQRNERPSRTVHRAVLAFGACLLVALSILTIQQIAVWRNSITLWTSVLEQGQQRSPVPYLNRGLAYAEQGQHDRAVEDYSAAIALGRSSRYSYLAYRSRGVALTDLGRFEEGIGDLNRAISMDPTRDLAYFSRGIAWGKNGSYDRAIDDLGRAIALNPSSAGAYVGRGVAFARTGKLALALEDLNRAVHLDPYNVDAYVNRGACLEQNGQLDLALSDYSMAITLDSTDHLAYGNRGRVYWRMDRVDDAIEDFTLALALKPDFPMAYLYRGEAYAKAGRRGDALSDFRKACDLGSSEGCDALNASQL